MADRRIALNPKGDLAWPPNPVTLDFGEPRAKALLDAIEHIEAAMALIDRNGEPFASLLRSGRILSEHLGSLLLNRARDAASLAAALDRVTLSTTKDPTNDR